MDSTKTIVEALSNLRDKIGLKVSYLSDNWVIKMSRDDQTHYIYGYFYLEHNSQAASENALDKVATYILLNNAGLPSVPHYLLLHPGILEPDKALINELVTRHGQLVIKPNKSGHGRLISRCSTTEEVLKAVSDPQERSWCASPFIDIKTETRVVIYNSVPMLAYVKDQPREDNGLPMFNLQLGARSTRVGVGDLPDNMVKLASSSLAALGLKLAAVDIVTKDDGSIAVIEVNAAFSLEHYAATSKVARRDVVSFYETVIGDLFK